MKNIKKKLNNGMTVVMVPIKYTQVVSMGFFVNAGSRNETEENNGIAHFLEHMMFKGTKTRTSTDLFHELDILGTVYNAATTAQFTYYYIYGNANNIKEILDIISDIYVNSRFETKEINKEKKVIIEEMRLRSDDPTVKLYISLHKKIFANTSLERPIIGSENIITDIKRKDFINFRTSLYKPSNTVFVMVGNFRPEPIYKIVEKTLGELENPTLNPVSYCNEKKIIMDNMTNQNEPYVYIKKNTLMQQVYIMLAFPLYDLYQKYSREIDLIAQLLSSGFSSRLSKALRVSKGITYNSSAYPVIYSDSGIFIIQMVMNPIDLVRGMKIIMNELKKVKNELITKDEMSKIINVIKNENIYSLIRPIDLLIYFGLNVLSDRNFKYNFKKEITELKKITRKNIQNVAREIFIRDKINLFIYGNTQIVDYNFLDL